MQDTFVRARNRPSAAHDDRVSCIQRQNLSILGPNYSQLQLVRPYTGMHFNFYIYSCTQETKLLSIIVIIFG